MLYDQNHWAETEIFFFNGVDECIIQIIMNEMRMIDLERFTWLKDCLDLKILCDIQTFLTVVGG